MATSHERGGRRAHPVTPGTLPDLEFVHSKDNVPNPEVLLQSLRFSGYTLETAVGDLADNPLDAGADTVVVALDKHEGEWALSVGDNGVGMDFETLDQMMRLGSHTLHDPATDLGAFGLGSTTASLSLGRLQHVVTSCEQGQFLSAATDLDEIMRAKKFVKHLDVALPAEVDFFAQAFYRWGLDIPTTGTVVRVGNIDNMGRTSLGPAVEALKNYIGQTYRYFIWAGKQFYVNGQPVEAQDPIERESANVTRIFEETVEYTYPKGHTRAGEVERIGVVIVHLPDWGPEANKEHRITLDRSGFYLMRNRREIVPHTTLDLYTRHNALIRLRGELLFPATMDQDLGVSFLKSAWDIKPSQSLKDKLQNELGPYVRQVRKMYATSLSRSAEQVSHEEAARVITQRSPFLRNPQTKIESRRRRNGETETHEVLGEPKTTRSPQEPRTQKGLADKVVFEVKDLGPTAPFYDASLDGRRVIVTYNGQHPFYQRFILENKDNYSVLSGIDYLVYSLATAELLAMNEDTYRFIGTMRENLSFNLRQLLTT